MKRSLYFLLVLLFTACSEDLNLKPFDKISPETAFSTEKDLQLYAYSFYNILPSATEIVQSDGLSDYLVGSNLSTYLAGTFSANQATGWSWSELRNVNYFLEHFQQANITEASKNHYAGLARFFRAWFYWEKVKQFGNVPWYDKTLSVEDQDLYKSQDSRELVMQKVLEDLNFACQNIRATKDNSSSQVTKWAALAFKSRVCLFEGTFRKYHKELQLEDSADMWLQESTKAAEELMKSKQYEVYTDANPAMSYRQLFVQEAPVSKEIILAAATSQALRVFHNANWYWTSATYGGRYSFTKTFINTYLNIDGSRFTDTPGYMTTAFASEVKNRDLRLQQTIRMGDYKRDGVVSPPDFTYSYTGYMPLKFTVDSKKTDGVAENFNSMPIIRYAEVLLNYAEARAELGLFNADDWAETIAKLRQRAGILKSTIPQETDPYLKSNFFPSITDAVLLEIRRERGIELAMEGFRYDDLKRWKAASLLEKPYLGMYVAEMNKPYDMNEDGKADVSFVSQIPAQKVPGVYYFLIDGKQFRLSNQTSGNLIVMDNVKRNFQDYKYFYPIPFDEIILNPALKQNPGW